MRRRAGVRAVKSRAATAICDLLAPICSHVFFRKVEAGCIRVWIAGGVTDKQRCMDTLALTVEQELGRDWQAGGATLQPQSNCEYGSHAGAVWSDGY